MVGLGKIRSKKKTAPSMAVPFWFPGSVARGDTDRRSGSEQFSEDDQVPESLIREQIVIFPLARDVHGLLAEVLAVVGDDFVSQVSDHAERFPDRSGQVVEIEDEECELAEVVLGGIDAGRRFPIVPICPDGEFADAG